MNKKNKFVSVLLLALLAFALVALAACGGGNNDEDDQTTPPVDEGQQQTEDQVAPPDVDVEPDLTPEGIDPQTFRGIPYDTVGQVTVMLISGDDTWRPDIGNQNLGPDDFGGAMNVAAIHAVAREFNQIFPNIQVNLWSQTGSPNRDDTPWEEHRAIFQEEHGIPADIFHVTNLVGEIERGFVADLSVFNDDPRMMLFNPAIVDLMSYDNRLFGLPQWMVPGGIWVNRALANEHNIDIPPINWTWEQYMAFASHSSHEEFYGGVSIPWNVMNSATTDIHHQLFNRGPNDPFVNIDTEANRQFVRDAAQFVPHAVWQQRNQGLISDEWHTARGSSSWGFFRHGATLTNNQNAYMISGAALPGGANEVASTDWDIFPRPATAQLPNHVGISIDPIALRNFAGADGVLTPEAWLQKQIAWEFATFWLVNNASWSARANQVFHDSAGAPQRALNPSFSFATGYAFEVHMHYWGSVPARQRFLDANLMPGWQEVMRLWNEGYIWEVVQTVYPWTFEFEGGNRAIAHEWWNRHTEAVAGAAEHEPEWADLVISLMPEWDRVINERWDEAFVRLYDAIARFYPILTIPE